MRLAGTNFRLHNKRLSILIAALLLSTLVLAACGSPNNETSVDTPAAVEPSESESPTETVTEPEQEAAEAESVLRVAMQPIVQTDPALISSDSEILVASHVYDYLVDIDPESNPIPRLAHSWDISPDGLSYIFYLEEGVTWHDGTPLTADDVVWTFERLRDPDSGLPTADLYSGVESVEATGDLEVTFTLADPSPFFLYDVSDNHALIVKNGTEEATDFMGTGPFRVTNYSAEDRVEMEANRDYFLEGLPQLDRLEIIFFNDETASIDALRSGQIDLAMRMSTSLFESLQGQPGINTVSIPTNGFDLVRLRADRPPGDDPLVRQALKLATDREAILGLVQQGYGAIGNDSPIGPLYEAYHDPSATPPDYDVAEARRLLEEAGYEDGFEMVLHVPDTGGRPDLATVLQSQWQEIGINVEVSVEPESVYYGDDGWLEVDLGITGWGSRPYPQFYLETMVACDAVWNEAHFCAEELDELIATAGTTLDEEERVQAYAEIQQYLAAEGPYIIPYYFAQFAAINDAFENFELKAFAGRSDFRNVSLAD
ncbi:MAG: ABC transporter substrate-binding protein [Anaerolineae bacterium]|nr:ABC transporter substrate-binding protein [Anaerolineae bacterium]